MPLSKYIFVVYNFHLLLFKMCSQEVKLALRKYNFLTSTNIQYIVIMGELRMISSWKVDIGIECSQWPVEWI